MDWSCKSNKEMLFQVGLWSTETNVAKCGFVLYFFCQFQLVSAENKVSWNMSKQEKQAGSLSGDNKFQN